MPTILVIYKCIKCGNTWEKYKKCLSGNTPKDNDSISHGLCNSCIIELVKFKINRSQEQQGYTPCFGRKKDFFPDAECIYKDCEYYSICNENS